MLYGSTSVYIFLILCKLNSFAPQTHTMSFHFLQKYLNFPCRRMLVSQRNSMPMLQQRLSIASKPPGKQDHPEIPKNVLSDCHSAASQTEMGKIYDKKPFRMPCVPGKKYVWCACGQSKSQPMCDGTHKNIYLKIKMRPVVFQVDKEKDYWLCNCKQTANRPFCDGTHKREDIQAAVKS
ncbi:hypothetical protein B566_EDAN016770 [Ephemera danica]|nr:hypothetical protein B566_EDAN016770 [Ephemera danica]